jgi:hypothetical protein
MSTLTHARPSGPRLATTSQQAWSQHKPRPHLVRQALQALEKALPPQWLQPLRALGLGRLAQGDQPEWAACFDALVAIDAFGARHGRAAEWNLDDQEIRRLALRLADEAGELDASAQAQEMDLAGRIDLVRLVLRMLGMQEPAPLVGEPAIRRAQDPAWWRRLLRRHVTRTVEAGAIKLGIVNRRAGGYASHATVHRRTAQLERNAQALQRSLYKNEAGQVFTLAELAALSPANPVVRGGELMTRIRGAQEYADARNHVGLFLTLTAPSRFHAVTLGSGGRPRPNPRYDGDSTPRDAQLWLRKAWQRTRAQLAREGLAIYGIRVAEPHHDATPHWHALVWTEHEAAAQRLETVIRTRWLAEDGDEPGAARNRVHVKRMTGGGAAGYVAKYIAKSVGHAALADHLDVVQGRLWEVEQDGMPGHRRVDAWAACWGIRQFQAIGMPSVCVWRELRRVSKDQIDDARLDGDRSTWKAWGACHRQGPDIQADWRRYMEAMGGHCLGRDRWHLRLARRPVPAGAVNQYGEAIAAGQGRVVGLQTRSGRWLVSRRIAWRRVVRPTETFDPGRCTDADGGRALALGADRAPLARPWTGFNNCTARLTGHTLRALFGRGRHEARDWSSPMSPDSVLYRPGAADTAPVFPVPALPAGPCMPGHTTRARSAAHARH